jgi:hypothetical protein
MGKMTDEVLGGKKRNFELLITPYIVNILSCSSLVYQSTQDIIFLWKAYLSGWNFSKAHLLILSHIVIAGDM